MKFLSNYLEESTNRTLAKYHAFYAFSSGRLKELSHEGFKYVHIKSGLCCPEDFVKDLLAEIETNFDKAVELDLKENGIANITERELRNHECYYTGDPTNAIDVLVGYPGITRDSVLAHFKGTKNENV